MWRYLFLIILVISCASKERTKYQPYSKKEGGYRDKVLEENLRVVNFSANSYTKKSMAERFAKFRAIETCMKEGAKVTHFLDTLDKTESREVTRSSTSGYPSYYYGMSPFYGRYSGFGYGFGYSSYDTNTWSETIRYPELEVIYECTSKVYEPKVDFREVSAEEMKHLVKDLQGALQVMKILKDSPNQTLRKGDIVLRGNGERIQKIYQLLGLFRNDKAHSIRLEIMRDGNMKTGVLLKGVDVTESILEEQNAVIKAACKHKEIKKNALCE